MKTIANFNYRINLKFNLKFNLKINYKIIYKSIWNLLIITLLVACAHDEHRAENVIYRAFDPHNFEVKGKIAMRYPICAQYRGCREESSSGAFTWLHQNEREFLTIFDPMGKVNNKLTYADSQLWVEEGAKTRHYEKDELSQEFGVELPFTQLAKWITTPRQEETFEELGWRVILKNWQGNYYSDIKIDKDDYHLRIKIYS